jgi:plasmid maintenance system antidote protein VapI
MKDQLIKILTYLGITATRFADEIGVQRSSISHILSGRNKPSYDFILRIIEKYPSINPTWLLTGKGTMLLDKDENEKAEKKAAIQSSIILPSDTNESSGKTNRPENNQSGNIDISKQRAMITNVNNVDCVLLLFTDGTFIQYKKNE